FGWTGSALQRPCPDRHPIGGTRVPLPGPAVRLAREPGWLHHSPMTAQPAQPPVPGLRAAASADPQLAAELRRMALHLETAAVLAALASLMSVTVAIAVVLAVIAVGVFIARDVRRHSVRSTAESTSWDALLS